jgi:hypothetical protein
LRQLPLGVHRVGGPEHEPADRVLQLREIAERGVDVLRLEARRVGDGREAPVAVIGRAVGVIRAADGCLRRCRAAERVVGEIL